MTARDDATTLLDAAAGRLRTLLPDDVHLADAHAHLGLDEDGMSLALDALLAGMDRYGIRRALVFPLNEPDREPNYTAPNDRVLEWAAQSGGRLVPLARLDLAGNPIAEARRCLAKGARGIKLHPRAQRFAVDDRRLEPVFELAEESRLPILIHAGRGMPPIGEALARVSERHPGAILILAHAAIVDQEHICELVAGMPNVFFDTSTWSAADVFALLSRVSPEQVLYAADMPYGNFLSALTLITSVLVELDAPEALQRGVLGGTLEGILRGELPATMSEPLAPASWTFPHSSLRVFSYLAAATPLVWMRQADAIGLLGLALGACVEDGLAPVGALIDAAARLWADWVQSPDGDRNEPFSETQRAIYGLLHLAQTATYTPRTSAAVPV